MPRLTVLYDGLLLQNRFWWGLNHRPLAAPRGQEALERCLRLLQDPIPMKPAAPVTASSSVARSPRSTEHTRRSMRASCPQHAVLGSAAGLRANDGPGIGPCGPETPLRRAASAYRPVCWRHQIRSAYFCATMGDTLPGVLTFR